MSKVDYLAPGLTVANAEDLLAMLRYEAADYATATAFQKLIIDHAITRAGQAAATWGGRGFWWSQSKAKFDTCYQAITKVARSASNVATLTVASGHGVLAGCRMRVNGVTTTAFDDDDAVVTSVTSTTIVYANTGDEVTEVADATGTVAVHAYPLRTINSSVLADLWQPQSVKIETDYSLGKITKGEYEDWVTFYASGTGQPRQYAIWEDTTSVYSTGMYMGAIPICDDDYTIRIPYIRRHSKITNAGSNDTALIVPAEYHMEVYVYGALWLLRHETVDTASLKDCPQFMDAMKNMAANDPSEYGDSQEGFSLPANRRVSYRPDGGVYVTGDVDI